MTRFALIGDGRFPYLLREHIDENGGDVVLMLTSEAAELTKAQAVHRGYGAGNGVGS